MPSGSVIKKVETWEISVNRINKIWRATFPSIIATFWLVTNSKEKVFIDKDIRNLLDSSGEDQILAVFGRRLKDLLNLHPLTYEKGKYPISFAIDDVLTQNGTSEKSSEKASVIIGRINDFLVELSKYRRVINSLYKGIDIELTSARKKLGINGEDGTSDEKEGYADMSEFKFRVDSLCNSLDKISVRLICMTGLVLTEAQDNELEKEIDKTEACIQYLLDRRDSFEKFMGKGKVLYDDGQREEDLFNMTDFLLDEGETGFYPIKQELQKIREIVLDATFQNSITDALNGKSDVALALNANYEVLIDDRLCYDLIYTDKGVIFPWPPKPESSLMIFDLYVTREMGSSIAVSIPGFSLSASSNVMVPVRKNVDDTHAFDQFAQFDQKCSQIEEVVSDYRTKLDEDNNSVYRWSIIGTTFNRLQMALPRVIASIWGDQELYNKYAAISNNKYVKEGRKIAEIEEEVLEYIKELKNNSSDSLISKEWLNQRGARVKRLKNKYKAKVYGIKGSLDELEIDFAAWLGLFKDGISPEIENERFKQTVSQQLVKVTLKGSDGLSPAERFFNKHGDYWEKIISSLSRSRYKLKKIDFHFEIWDVPEVITLVDCIHNDLSFVTHTLEDFREKVLGEDSSGNKIIHDEDGRFKGVELNIIDQNTLGTLKLFFKEAVEQTSKTLKGVGSELRKLVGLKDDEMLEVEYTNDDNKYGEQISAFVRVQAEVSLPEFFGIYVKPKKMRQGSNGSSEVFLSPRGLSIPFPLRPSLDQIYQSWASNDAGIPTFSSTMKTGT